MLAKLFKSWYDGEYQEEVWKQHEDWSCMGLWSSVEVTLALALVFSTHREHSIPYPATRERRLV